MFMGVVNISKLSSWGRLASLFMVSLSAVSLVPGCGKKKASGQDVQPTGQLALNFAAATSKGNASALALSALENTPTPATKFSIASGAPDSFEVSVMRMDLVGSGGSPVVNIFKSDTGKPIKVTGSEIDLSQLFTTYDCYAKDGTAITLAPGETCKCGVGPDNKVIAPQADGTCKLTKENGELIEITEPVGLIDVSAQSYAEIRVTFAPKAKIKGCVEATFASQPDQVANGSSGYQKYCTQASLATTNENITPGHSEFKNKIAEETEIYLSKGWEPRNQNVEINFPIKGGLNIAAGQKTQLTMVIDVNRMLRFYNMGRKNQGPNPGFPTNRAYFFTTLFADSLYVFAGKAGSIRGYGWQVDACIGTFANEFTCASSSKVDGWLTLILDANGEPFVASAMPDDDNNFTTLKGANRKKDGIDASMISKNADGSYNVSVSLSTAVDPVLYKFDLSKAKGSIWTGDYRGITSDFGTGQQDTFGRITYTRGL